MPTCVKRFIKGHIRLFACSKSAVIQKSMANTQLIYVGTETTTTNSILVLFFPSSAANSGVGQSTCASPQLLLEHTLFR